MKPYNKDLDLLEMSTNLFVRTILGQSEKDFRENFQELFRIAADDYGDEELRNAINTLLESIITGVKKSKKLKDNQKTNIEKMLKITIKNLK